MRSGAATAATGWALPVSRRQCDAIVWAAALVAWTWLVFAVVRAWRVDAGWSAASAHHAAVATDGAEQQGARLPADAAQVVSLDGAHPVASAKAPPRERRDCVCPAIAACADGELEQACLDYLGNYSNIQTLRPMVSNLRVGRTAKLRAVYRDPCVEAILKLPQSMFPLEPYAEYLAFETDRYMAFGNVPPTTFVFVPVADIERAVADFANTAAPAAAKKRSNLTVAPTAAGGHEYARWIATDVVNFAMHKGLIVTHPDTGKLVLGCSAQLFLRSARPMHRSVLAVEDAYKQLLRSPEALDVALSPPRHSDDGFGGGGGDGPFSTKLALSVVSYAAQLIASHNTRVASGAYDLGGIAGAGRAADIDRRVKERGIIREAAASQDSLSRREMDELNELTWLFKGMAAERRAAVVDALRYLSDTLVFDAIIGNDDRGPQKNSHVYVVDPGVVPARCKLGGPRHAGRVGRAAAGGAEIAVDDLDRESVLRPLWLDQGKAFYKQGLLNPWLEVPLRPHESVCVFRRATLAALRGARGGEVFRRFQTIVPPAIIAAVGDKRLMWVGERVDRIADHATQCGIALGSEAKIQPWD